MQKQNKKNLKNNVVTNPSIRVNFIVLHIILYPFNIAGKLWRIAIRVEFKILHKRYNFRIY